MIESTPWSSKKALAALSRKPIGRKIAEQVAAKLIRDRGRRGIWNCHKDYCGHGLVFLNSKICLVRVHDGFAHEGLVLKSWESDSEFIDWLEKQSDYSLSGADESEKEIFTTNSFALNNQTISRTRLTRYLAGEPNP